MIIRASGGSQLYAYSSSEHGVHKESVWMSHGDSIDKLPAGFEPVATSEQVLLFRVGCHRVHHISMSTSNTPLSMGVCYVCVCVQAYMASRANHNIDFR